MTEQEKASSPPVKSPPPTIAPTNRLLAWYDDNRRNLPWRSLPGAAPEPYHVWLSEVMLQQTTVATVRPRFQAFLKRWPTVKALAAASLDDVLHEWQGLGYYARARNLHACAVAVAHEHGGVFPTTEAGLLGLPGIGEYTAAAVAAIAFGEATAPVDGNIIRVISRLNMLDTPMPGGKKQIEALVSEMVPTSRPGDFAQAMMDLGAMVCTPRKPDCMSCPWGSDCRAHAEGEEERFPVRKAKPEKPTRHGTVFWLVDEEDRILLRRRPEKGLLGGMMEFPSTDWRATPWEKNEAIGEFPASNNKATLHWKSMPGDVHHTFTHFHLVLTVIAVQLPGAGEALPTNGQWCPPDRFHEHALPTVMKKVAAHALNNRNRSG